MDHVTSSANVILKFKFNKFLASDDGVEEVILSSFNNSVNEIKGGKVVAFYRFPKPISVVQRLKVFYSYEPKFKHYTVMNGSDLIILRKTKSVLTLHKIYTNVVDYEVGDHWNIGRPQIIVRFGDQENTIITDCHVENGFDQVQTKRVPAFAQLIQKSKLRIANAEKSLDNKFKLLAKVSRALVFNCEDENILSTIDKLVYLREGLADGDAGLLAKRNALSVGKSWFKAFYSFWIIAFPVVNISNENVSSFEMYLSHSCITIEKTVIFTNDSSKSEIYRQSNMLASNQCGVLVGVVKEPAMIDRFYTLECLCSFEEGQSSYSGQSYLGKFEIATEDFISEKYRLFAPKLSIVDIIAIQAALTSYVINFRLIEIDKVDFIDVLQSNFNMKKFNSFTLVNDKSSSIFYESLIIINEDCNVLTIYSNAVNNSLIVIHKMVSLFQGKVSFQLLNDNLAPALGSLKREISYIKGLMIQEMLQDSEDNPSPVSVNLKDVSRELMFLEMNTAATMNSFNG